MSARKRRSQSLTNTTVSPITAKERERIRRFEQNQLLAQFNAMVPPVSSKHSSKRSKNQLLQEAVQHMHISICMEVPIKKVKFVADVSNE